MILCRYYIKYYNYFSIYKIIVKRNHGDEHTKRISESPYIYIYTINKTKIIFKYFDHKVF